MHQERQNAQSRKLRSRLRARDEVHMERGVAPVSYSILVVDDDPISLEIIALLLAAEGHHVVQADSGEYAMAMLLSTGQGGPAHVPDIVLVDMQMPGISGHDIRRYISSLPTPRPRIIGMSATTLQEESAAQFDEFLLKPIDFERLRDAISGIGVPRQETSAPEGQGNALDQNVLQKLKAILPPEAIREIYSTYITDTRQRIAELERCSSEGDMDGLRRCAHMIKGSAAMAGVFGIFGIASVLEAGTIPKENLQSLFQHLRIACDDVEQTIAYNAPERL